MTCSWCNRTHDGGPEHCIRGVVLVCGGRDYSNWTRVLAVLDKVAARVEMTTVRHGAARGADSLADRWAHYRGFAPDPFPADWQAWAAAHPGERPNRAGFERNELMATTAPVPVLCVAFPGGNGTADMVSRAEAHGIRVWAL